MIDIFCIDRDGYLKDRLGFKYEGTYNSLNSIIKRKMIDKLVRNVQVKDCEHSLTGLILIFEATFKSLNSRFMGTLSSQFGYTSDAFMTELLSHFYYMTRYEFNRKGKEGFRANFNRFIHVKLGSKARCVLSKEKIYRKYAGAEIDYTISDKRIKLDTSLSNKLTMELQDALIDWVNSTMGEDNTMVYRRYINGETMVSISEKEKLDIKRVRALIKEYKRLSAGVIVELKKEYKL